MVLMNFERSCDHVALISIQLSSLSAMEGSKPLNFVDPAIKQYWEGWLRSVLGKGVDVLTYSG